MSAGHQSVGKKIDWQKLLAYASLSIHSHKRTPDTLCANVADAFAIDRLQGVTLRTDNLLVALELRLELLYFLRWVISLCRECMHDDSLGAGRRAGLALFLGCS